MIGFILGFISCLVLLFIISCLVCKRFYFYEMVYWLDKIHKLCRDFPTSMKWGVERKSKS